MFPNRFTAFIDASAVAGALKRNLLLSLAESEFFRIRWSVQVLYETQRAIQTIPREREVFDAADRAARARCSVERAFKEALVTDFDHFLCVCTSLPDPKDAHVVAAALKTQAAVIVTDNLRHFPGSVLGLLNLEARSADAFIADTITLDQSKAVEAIRRMRQRLKRPEMTGEALLLSMEAKDLAVTVDVLRPFSGSL